MEDLPVLKRRGKGNLLLSKSTGENHPLDQGYFFKHTLYFRKVSNYHTIYPINTGVQNIWHFMECGAEGPAIWKTKKRGGAKQTHVHYGVSLQHLPHINFKSCWC